MAKLFNRLIKQAFRINNAPSTRPSGKTINRDPKVITVKRVGYALNRSTGRDEFETPKVDFNLINTAIERDSYMMHAATHYKDLMIKSSWHLKGKNEQVMEYLRWRFEIMAVATQITFDHLIQGIADDIVRYANSFVVKARAKKGKGLVPGLNLTPVPPAKEPIAGYFRLPPSTIQISRDEYGNIIKYRQEVEGGGDPIEFKPEDIIHFYVNKPVGEAFGIPHFAPVIEDVRLLRKVEENAALLLYKHIFPLLTYQVGLPEPGQQATEEEIEEVRAQLENMSVDSILVHPERHKLDSVKLNAFDAHHYLTYFENRVFSGLGMSAVDMGRGDTANRSTADAMTGIKADRVKGWQRQLQHQIDRFIIDELLIEGGYDPLVNPDFNVDFVFNEIEIEQKMKIENHEILKWQSNVQTWEETRKNIGMDPVADESRLYFMMIDPKKDSAKGTVENNSQPENQYGKRQGPKRKTESANFLQNDKKKEELIQNLHQVYNQMEQDCIVEIQKEIKKSGIIRDIGALLTSAYMAKDLIRRHVQETVKDYLIDGAIQAKEDAREEREPAVRYEEALKVISESVSDTMERFYETLKNALEARIKDLEDESEAIIRTRSVFQSLRHRIDKLVDYTIVKSYNYGYALAALKYNFDQVYIQTNPFSCLNCIEKAVKPLSLKSISSFDEILLYYRIPAHHPGCQCQLSINRAESVPSAPPAA